MRKEPRADQRRHGSGKYPPPIRKRNPNSSEQGLVLEDDEHSSVAGQSKAGNPIDHLLQKTSTAQDVERDRKVPVATTFNVEKEIGTESKGRNHVVRLSGVKTMIDQALVVSEKSRDSRVAQIARMTVNNALEMCVVDGHTKSSDL